MNTVELLEWVLQGKDLVACSFSNYDKKLSVTEYTIFIILVFKGKLLKLDSVCSLQNASQV